MTLRQFSILIALTLTCASCDRLTNRSAPAEKPAPDDPSTRRLVPIDERKVDRVEATDRIVVIGDVHGDLDALEKALQTAGVVDDEMHWVGGETVVVQTGDLLDRGDDEREIIDLLHRLRGEALEAGGHVVLLAGNHELMNVLGDLRYVTPEGLRDFDDIDGLDLKTAAQMKVPEQYRHRWAAFHQGGPYATRLATHSIFAIVDDTLFVHGGALPSHVRYGLERYNIEATAWMKGEAPRPGWIAESDNPVWTRLYSDEEEESDCDELQKVLDAAKVERLVVGHTPQKDGINSACDGRVFRVDTGMSDHYGGPVEVLEISADGNTDVLRP